MAGRDKNNANLMHLIKRMHGVVENTDIGKQRQSQDHIGALLGGGRDVLTKDLDTILVGQEAVREGIISEVGGIRQALGTLHEMVENGKKKNRDSDKRKIK